MEFSRIKMFTGVKICKKIFCPGYGNTERSSSFSLEKESWQFPIFCIENIKQERCWMGGYDVNKVAEVIAELTEEMQDISDRN